jgi:hypothetical protein
MRKDTIRADGAKRGEDPLKKNLDR